MSVFRRQLVPGRSLSCWLLLVAVGALAICAGRAHADPARARAHFELGRRYFQVDEYAKAIEEFKAAHIEESDPAFLYNIAECHRRMGASKEALVYYKRFLNLTPPGAPSRANAEKRIAELQGTSSSSSTTTTTPAPPAKAPLTAPAASAAAAPSATRVALTPRPRETPAPTVAIAAPPATALTAPADASSAPVDEASRPFYKRGWFYVVLGAVVVAGAAGLWVATSNRNGIPSSDLGNQGVFQ
jgi:tetratricopeptide (TPR) repeat protein